MPYKPKKKKPPFAVVFGNILARNESAYANDRKDLMTDEQIVLELAYQLPKSGVVKRLLANDNVTVHKLRNQFNRGEMHYLKPHTTPDFFSYRYDSKGNRIDRSRPLSVERQEELLHHWQEKRKEWRIKHEHRSKQSGKGPTFPRPCVLGKLAGDVLSTPAASTSSSTAATPIPMSSS